MENVQSITTSVGNSSVPTFLLKLLNLLQESEYHDYVSWSEDGTSFVVHDQAGFAKHVLPKYFKHNKFASFVRQLNMYGFRKVTTVAHGGISDLSEAIEFYHPYFIRDKKSLLFLIKRKVTQSTPKQSEDLNQVLEDVNGIKYMQSDISNTLSDLKRENEDLWREIVSLRQKHSQQQKVVNHLIKFLVSLVQHHGMGVKRRLPLMIDDESGASQTPVKVSRNASNLDSTVNSRTSKNIYYDDSSKLSSTDGPLITELLTPGVSSPTHQPNTAVDTLSNTNTGSVSSDEIDFSDLIDFENPEQESAISTQLLSNDDPPGGATASSLANETGSTIQPDIFLNVPPNTTVGSSKALSEVASSSDSKSSSGVIAPLQSKSSENKVTENINLNVEKVNNDLRSIQRRLSNNQHVDLDYDLLQNLFSNSTDITPSIAYDQSLSLPITQPTGNELVQYNPDPSKDKPEMDYNDIMKLLNE